ncbi:MAG: wax ester/triacylglycerol synthase family O-acyltransferase [Burkholderiales bacterium]|nr:wax ester/triacylglycerol synthase family O-acyltransferase [Burkholderiales bacterium]
MRQLSASDARFLYADTARANANVTKIQIYDQSTAPGGHVRFKTILAHIESRLAQSPAFRQKLHRVPLELDYPYWVEDEDFDLEYHVRHIALPKPGDWRQFCIQASRIHARALDLARPLWEIYVIEGLDGFLDLPRGSFALLTKVHHAAIDLEDAAGVATGITAVLHDTSPTPAPPAPPAPWFPEPAPGAVRMIGRGIAALAAAPLRLARPLSRALSAIAPSAFGYAGEMLLTPEKVVATRFNAAVSAHRVFETRRFLLAEFKEIRALVPGATVNDAVLAVCGGALRRYLEAERELPAANLTAIAPFFVREAGGGDGGRRAMAWMRVHLETGTGDAVRRLAAIHRQTASSATVARAVRARELTDLAQHTPAATLALVSKVLARAVRGIGRRAPLANCTITNVPGPAQPLYLCGARMTYFSAIMPIADGMGLVFAVTSYDGRIIISPTSCRELMPDPARFAQCIRDSFQEYLALARGGAVEGAAPVRRTRPKASSSGAASRRPRSARTAATAPRVAPGGRPRSTARPR